MPASKVRQAAHHWRPLHVAGSIGNPGGILPKCPACLKWSSVFSLAIQSTKLPTSKATVYMANTLHFSSG